MKVRVRIPDNWKVESSLSNNSCKNDSLPGYQPTLLVKSRRPTWEMEAVWSLTVPRKEVIQPHLPVRLPCYDFTPITDPTLDACLPSEEGLAQRLQGLPTFVV